MRKTHRPIKYLMANENDIYTRFSPDQNFLTRIKFDWWDRNGTDPKFIF